MTPRKPSGIDPAKLARDRQQRYLDRALKDPDGLLLTRLQVIINASAASTLDRIVSATGETKRQIVERAILELARQMEEGKP